MISTTAPAFSSLLDLLQYRASEASGTANNPAFTFLEDGETVSRSITFAELDVLAQELAAQLQRLAPAGSRVMIVHAPGIDYVIAFMACAYARLIAVPALPPTSLRALPRFQRIVEDATPHVVLTSGFIAGAIAAVPDGPTWLKNLNWIATDQAFATPATWTRPEVLPSDISFLQYTSGSTGRPKGVMVSHSNVLNNSALIKEAFRGTSSHTVVSWLPPHHDMGLIGMILTSLFAGAHCVQFSPLTFVARPYRWLKLLSDHRAFITGAPNFAYELCVNKITEAEKRTLDLSHLRYALNGAEPIRPATLRRFVKAFEICGLRPEAMTPVYGLAEATLMVSVNSPMNGDTSFAFFSKQGLKEHVASAPTSAADSVELVATGAVDAGDHHAIIVDEVTNARLADGSVGEIWVHGPSVALGYWNRPEETERTFGARVLGEGPRYLRTGDLGFVDGGQLYVTGRIKEMMIFAGRNVYPQDIEATVEQVDSSFRVNGCAAFSIELDGVTQLVVMQEIDFDKEASPEGLPARVRVALAEEHDLLDVAAIVLVKAGRVPRTSSGKIQRGRCRELFLSGSLECVWMWRRPPLSAAAGGKSGQIATRSSIEGTLLKMWKELFALDGLSVDDDFFALGGHSLLASQLVSRVRDVFEVELPLRAIFEASTVAELALRIEGMTLGAGDGATAALTATVRGATAPLSFAQQRLWFLDQYESGSSFYNVPAAVRLRGTLDLPTLQRTLDEVLRRHESLRTTFALVDGAPVQVIAPPRAVPLRTIDLGHMSNEAREAEALRLAREEAAAPFDLVAGPLFRVRLVRLSDDDHVMVVNQHHIISDGWSMALLIHEVSALYSVFLSDGASPLPPLRLQYADYAIWQRSCLTGDKLREQVDFWCDHLAGSPVLLELPVDRPRPPVQSYTGSSVAITLDAELVAGLRSLSQRHGTTLYMTLLAGWSALLSRLSGHRDLVLGTAVANRQRSEVEALLGFFVNTLALRVRLEDDPTVEQLLAQIKSTTLAALAHQELPFDQVVEALKPPRSLSHNPVVQVMMAMNNTPNVGALALPGLSVSEVALPITTTQFDLALSVAEVGDEVTGHLIFATDLFDASTVERWASHLKLVLRGMQGDSQRRVSELPLLSDAERRHLLVDFNDTAVAYPRELLVHQLFEARASDQPGAVALEYANERVTYGELNRRANRIAHRLLAVGVRPDDRVAIYAERSTHMVEGLLGILKAGAAYVPLEPTYPIDRLTYMLNDSSAVTVLTQAALRAKLPELTLPVLDLEESAPERGAAADLNPNAGKLGITSSNLAYVLYTSGSTGLPKGVMNEHAGVVNRLLWAQDQYQLTPDDRVLQKTPFSFDVSAWEFFWTLGVGAQLVIAKPEGHQDLFYLAEVIDEQGITLVHFVSSMLPIFLDQVQSERFAKLRRVIVGGESLPYPVQQRFMQMLPNVELHNQYGPTEAAIDVTYWRCCADRHVGLVPIGHPIANTQIYILDVHGQPVPMGVAGELYLGGVQVARGYLNREELTNERFLADSFSGEAGARLYRTGDLGRWLPDGAVHYIGRNDFQVKIRGFRIELGEIEAKLVACESVRDAVVIAREDNPGNKRLVAYVVLQPGYELSVVDLRAQLSVGLADYMIPAAFVALEALPLTPNGKLDRPALPAPGLDALATRPYEAPDGPLEVAVAQVWCDLLGLPQVSRNDNFFDLGGHSLLAIQLISKLRRLLQVELSLRTLFAQPTVAGLCAALGADADLEQLAIKADASHDPLVAIQAGSSSALPLFCVPGAGDSVTSYRELAHALGSEVPVYGLQARGLDGELEPHLDVETAARAYVEAIRRVLPHGPFQLLGHSFGGWIAFEMARQLVAAGEDIATLVLLDSRPPSCGDVARRRYTRVEMLSVLIKHFEASSGHSLPIDMQTLGALSNEQQLSRLLEALTATTIMPKTTQLASIAGLVRVFETNLDADYRPDSIYHGNVRLVGAAEALDIDAEGIAPAVELLARWRVCAPASSAWRCSGNHLTMLTAPHVLRLAEWLRPQLKNVHSASRGRRASANSGVPSEA